MKKLNKKGFTLAELLIVVAIIAVLTAIAIPVFTSTLERAREAADLANIRAAYAEATVKALEQNGSGTYTESTSPAQSTGAFEKVDTSAITWATLPTSVTTGKVFDITVTLDASGNATATITQPTE